MYKRNNKTEQQVPYNCNKHIQSATCCTPRTIAQLLDRGRLSSLLKEAMCLMLVEFADILLATCNLWIHASTSASLAKEPVTPTRLMHLRKLWTCRGGHVHKTSSHMQADCSEQIQNVSQHRLKKIRQASADKTRQTPRSDVCGSRGLDTPAGAYVANSSASSRTSSKFPANSDTNSRRKYLGSSG